MNMEYTSIYLVLFLFHTSEFCSCAHIDLVHILLALYLSISLFGVLIIMVLCFLLLLLFMFGCIGSSLLHEGFL